MTRTLAKMTQEERTIREWVSRNCNPDPYGTVEQFRRANEAFALAIDQFTRSMTNEPR